MGSSGDSPRRQVSQRERFWCQYLEKVLPARFKPAAGLSLRPLHRFLEAYQLQQPFEAVGQRHQAPFGLDLDLALEGERV